MSEWRIIWKSALDANNDLIRNRRMGEIEFLELLHKYEDDGMVYYERAEAYEFIKDFENALKNFQKAEDNFPVEHWKRIARFGIDRINVKKVGGSYSCEEIQWQIFHQLHTLQNIDLWTKFDALVAMTLYDSEPHETALLLRCCLESLVLLLLPNSIEVENAKGLWELTNLLKKHYRINCKYIKPEIIRGMQDVRIIGTKAAHPKNRIGDNSFIYCVRPFILVAQWVNNEIGRLNTITQ